jgi:hypothetical protein
VWSSGGAVANRCPVSMSGGSSSAWLELFAMWRIGIVTISAEWWAKDLDAMTILSNESERMDERERP